MNNIIQNGIEVKWSNSTWEDKGIYVKDCPLSNPPREIVEQGNEAILRYWEQLEKQGAETLNEAKLIIVGEGKTGKTTLFNKLIDPAFDLEKNPTDETHGINVHEGLEIEEGFRANLWDFGGQDLQYMTHQFFLTPRALYVLVMEARTEAPNLPYWFRIISLLGKYTADEKVALLLVLNKRKGSTGRPQYEDLLKIYANDFDLEFFEVDFAVNDKRWESLREAIARRLRELPIVKNKLPKQWQPIREALRAESKTLPHISTERLDEICTKFDIQDEADQWQMTDYLHQLGSLLHFQNDPDLLTTVVLQAKWAVDGVYTTLKSELIKTQNGKFLPDDIFHILRSNGYKKADAQRILKLMSKNNFDICYPSKGGKHYVAAQLLPTDRPAQYTWHTRAGALQFRYRYAIMPKGLMSRLIVRLSEYIERLDEAEIVWRKGAILRIPVNNSICRVMMVEDEDSKSGLKQIVVEVLEDNDLRPNRKYALQLVRDEVESLHHRWFRNIQFEQIIPCNCRQCRMSATPFTFELSELQRLTKGMAFCNVLEDFVPVIQLLEGVYKEDEIRAFSHAARSRFEQEAEAPRMPDININIENNPSIVVTNQNTNIHKAELKALEAMLDRLSADKRAALQNYVEMLPEPDSPEEKNSLGKSILKWLDKNAEGIAVNISASVYYDALKFLFGF
ncbi:MAG: COR domain-containing protein [Saprospiraceae bacterium]